ncbi:MAG: FMN-binding protein [Coriobacteriia bacterium]
MRESLRLVVSVLVTCMVAATGLALTYAVAAPRIEEQDRLAQERSLKAVMPEADGFDAVEDEELIKVATSAAEPATLTAIYRAKRGGSEIGWAVRVSSRGYGGPMHLVIGLDTSGSVTGVSILSMNETPGLGTKVLSEKWFLAQFVGLPPGFDDQDVRALDVIAGSTRSANGIRDGVAAAGRAYDKALQGREEAANE